MAFGESDSEDLPGSLSTLPLPRAEAAPSLEQAPPNSTPSSQMTCWSLQHPSTTPATGWVELECWDYLDISEEGVELGLAVGPDGGVGYVASGSGSVGNETRNLAMIPCDSSGDDEPVATAQSASSFVSPLEFWIARIGNRMVEANEFVRGSCDRLGWELPPVGASIVDWAIAHILNTLSRQWVAAFYIGLTARLPQRWLGEDEMVGHKVKGWQRMILVGVSESSDEIRNAEIAVIARFRRIGQNEGHPLCTNLSPGGERGRGNSPPHLLYVCWQWNCSDASLGLF
jgi:hypothetical protein